MKLYNITPARRSFQFGEMNVLSLGEEGRGRKLVHVPFHADFDPDSDRYDLTDTKSGRKKIVQNQQSSPGWIARICTKGVYTRYTSGRAYIPKHQSDNIDLIEYAWGAYGDAGRVGSWADYLISVRKFPTTVAVIPSGGKHKCLPYWVVFTADMAVKVTIEEKDLFQEQYGIEFSKEDLVLLQQAHGVDFIHK